MRARPLNAGSHVRRRSAFARLAAPLTARRRLALISSIAIAFGFASACARAETFDVETAFQTIAEVGRSTSIDVDSDGAPHIAHTGERMGEGLWYSSRIGDEWTHECVRGLLYSQYASLQLDGADEPHIALSGGPQFALNYARRSAGVWTFEIVDPGQSSYCSLELDAAGNAHVAYRQQQSRVGYARRDGSGWAIEIVDGVSEGYSSSLDLDTAGQPHIAYIDFRTGFLDLRYARKVGGAWIIEVVDDGGASSIGVGCALALDSLDTPHIAYRDATLSDLRYARKVGSVWVRQVVDDGSGIATGYDAAIAIGPGRNPRLIYHVRQSPSFDGDVFYATRSGSTWAISTVDTEGSVGGFESIDVDDAGRTHIAYQVDWVEDLKYAVSALPTDVPPSATFERMLLVTPNPAGLDGAEIRFRVAETGAGALALYDASGRRIVVLRDGTLSAGENAIRWNGRDASGRTVAPGVYFARLEAGAMSHTERLVLVR